MVRQAQGKAQDLAEARCRGSAALQPSTRILSQFQTELLCQPFRFFSGEWIEGLPCALPLPPATDLMNPF
jgi:hypothetical protein